MALTKVKIEAPNAPEGSKVFVDQEAEPLGPPGEEYTTSTGWHRFGLLSSDGTLLREKDADVDNDDPPYVVVLEE